LSKDPCSIFATKKQITYAYRKLALKYHPDRQVSLQDKHNCSSYFQQISNAYNLLVDYKKRMVYDVKHNIGSHNTYYYDEEYIVLKQKPGTIFRNLSCDLNSLEEQTFTYNSNQLRKDMIRMSQRHYNIKKSGRRKISKRKNTSVDDVSNINPHQVIGETLATIMCCGRL